jgi:hypothetical protein
MQSATFREWLADRGCHFEQHERGEGHVVVTVRRGNRSAEMPLIGTHKSLDWETVKDICNALGLDWQELPGPKSRV